MLRTIALVFLIAVSVPMMAGAAVFEAVLFSGVEQDRIHLNSEAKNLLTSSYGLGLGGTWWFHQKSRFGLNYVAGFGGAHTKNADNTFQINQSHLAVYWAQVAPLYRLTSQRNLVQFGFSAPIFARYIDYQDPAVISNFPNKNRVNIGLGLDFGWRLSRKFSLFQKLQFPIEEGASARWLASLEWTL